MPANTYDPSIFNVPDMLTAMRVILTPEDGLPSHVRWERETPYLADLILSKVHLDENSCVLDFGCGVGRMAKELIKRTGCVVVGADISSHMRALSMRYVDHENFIVCHPNNIPTMGYSLALAIWVLQHVEDPEEEINKIIEASPDKFFVVNEEESPRVLPMKGGWFSDGKEIKIEGFFQKLESGKLDPAIVSEHASARTAWTLYG